jgi:radical SAM superfamily enzyme YgiQ (UPF0313 family)
MASKRGMHEDIDLLQIPFVKPKTVVARIRRFQIVSCYRCTGCSDKLKICISTTPIRPVPTTFPPFGSMAIIQSLRKIGEVPVFVNIDFFRFKQVEIETYFAENQFDIVGISAVVSTAYAYTKYLAGLIRRVSPQTIIIVGGNLAASAEVLLRKSEVNYCVVGDGEFIIRELVATLRDHGRDSSKLRAIKGICFLEDDGNFNFTGFGQRPTAAEVEMPDYTILEADGSLPYFIADVADDRFVSSDSKEFVGGRSATVVTTKGCVARCTFCHRWEKGFRVLPVDTLGRHLQLLKEKYRVSFIDVGDENFGSNRDLANELASRLGSLGMSWRAGGVRVNTVTPELLAHWKKNGCFSVMYGMESGSQKMLDVMEKKITVEQSLEALRWTYEAGLRTVVQLVIAMPGESDRTIRETIEFLKESCNSLYLGNNFPSSMISVNYAQALPGTPLYEYAREHGFIGQGIDEEEQYLLKISDTDAYKDDHFVNYTGQPLLKVLMWQQQIIAEVDAHYLRGKFGTSYSMFKVAKFYFDLIQSRLSAKVGRRFSSLRNKPSTTEGTTGLRSFSQESGYFNIRDAGKFTPLLLNQFTKAAFTPLLAFVMAVGRSSNLLDAAKLLIDYIIWHMSHPFRRPLETDFPKESLRKIVRIASVGTSTGTDKMIPLRTGR